MNQGEPSDHEALLHSLDKRLLDIIPDTPPVFVNLPSQLYASLPEKLLVGHLSNNPYPIYACWRQFEKQKGQRIDFFAVPDGKQVRISLASLIQHNISDPFKRTYLGCPQNLDPLSRTRFTTLVKWYFIAADHANCDMLGNLKDFQTRFEDVLQWLREQGVSKPNVSSAVRPGAGHHTSTDSSEMVRHAAETVERGQSLITGARGTRCKKEEEQDLINTQMALDEHVCSINTHDEQGIQIRSPHLCDPRTDPGRSRSSTESSFTSSTSSPTPSPENSLSNVATLGVAQRFDAVSRQASATKRKRLSLDSSPVDRDYHGSTYRSRLSSTKDAAIQSSVHVRNPTASHAAYRQVRFEQALAGEGRPDQTISSNIGASAECSLTKSLLEYLLPKLGEEHDEGSLQQVVETAWDRLEKQYNIFGKLNASHREAFAIWILERRGVAILRSKGKSQISVQEVEGQKLYALNLFRLLGQQWRSLRERHDLHDLHLDDFVGETMAALTLLPESNEKEISKWFKERLRSLRETEELGIYHSTLGKRDL